MRGAILRLDPSAIVKWGARVEELAGDESVLLGYWLRARERECSANAGTEQRGVDPRSYEGGINHSLLSIEQQLGPNSLVFL